MKLTEGITESAILSAAAPAVPTCEELVAEARGQLRELTSALAARDHVICPDGGARFCVVVPRGEVAHG